MSTDVRGRSATERKLDQAFIWMTGFFALAVTLVLIWIALTVGAGALEAMQRFGLGFLTNSAWNPPQDQYGILPMIYGTIMSSVVGLLISVPLGLGTAVFLSEDFIPTQIRNWLVFMVELLAAVPSVVYGLWGIFVLTPLIRPVGSVLNAVLGWTPLFATAPRGPSTLAAGAILAIMTLPIITAISRDSLASLPPELRQASIGLGATRWVTIIRTLVPAAFSGIIGGVMLALGRALGETMAVTMLIGNSNRLNFSLNAPGNTISSLLANQFAEASGLQVSALMYAGIVLFLLTLLVNILAQILVSQVKQV